VRDLKQRAIEACGHRGLSQEPKQSGTDQTQSRLSPLLKEHFTHFNINLYWKWVEM